MADKMTMELLAKIIEEAFDSLERKFDSLETRLGSFESRTESFVNRISNVVSPVHPRQKHQSGLKSVSGRPRDFV